MEEERKQLVSDIQKTIQDFINKYDIKSIALCGINDNSKGKLEFTAFDIIVNENKASIHLTQDEWNKLVKENLIKDISNEMGSSIMAIGQIMQSKIIYNDKKYFADAWKFGEEEPFVILKEIE